MSSNPYPIAESDLLGWVEGDLPPARRAEVERALAAEPDLRRLLASIAGDAASLRAVGREPVRAPAGLVERAWAAAQREALHAESDGAVIARIGPPIRRRFAVAAAFVALVGGGWLTYQSNWGSRRPPRGAPIAANDSLAGLTDALAIDAPDAVTTGAVAAADSTALVAAAQRNAGAADPDPDADAYDAEPVSEAVIASMLPLRQVMSALDRSGSDLSQRLVTLEVLEGQPRPVSRCPTPSRVSPASTQDALMLAGLSRLSVRVQTKDPSSVERAINAYAERANADVRVTSQALPDGAIRYSIETDRDPAELNLLVAALRNACEECDRRTFFDAPLAPQSRGPFGMSGATTPAMLSSPRVRLPVVIERISL